MLRVIRFHLDEHADPEIALALRRRGIDVTTAAEAGLLAASDEAHLVFATNEQRVLFTNDADFLRLAAHNSQHAGIAFCQRNWRSIGQIVAALELLHQVVTPEQMRGQVEFL